MRATLIVNPHATSTTERRRDLLAHALASEMRLTVEHTADRGHATQLAAKAVEDGARLIVVHGGDGTVNEVVNGIMSRGRGEQTPLLAVVPGGSTNVFARAVGIEADPTAATEQILEAVAQNRPPRPISLGRADERYFTFNAGLGLDAEVVKAVEERRAAGHSISNGLHVRKAVGGYFRSDRKAPRLSVELPGEDAVEGVHLVLVSNVDPWTYWESRAVRTNPGTSVATGLGVLALTSLRLPTVLRVSSQLLRSRSGPRSSRVVRRDDVDSIRVTATEPIGFQLDGDYLGLRRSVTFAAVPGALRVLGPVAPVGATFTPRSETPLPSADS